MNYFRASKGSRSAWSHLPPPPPLPHVEATKASIGEVPQAPLTRHHYQHDLDKSQLQEVLSSPLSVEQLLEHMQHLHHVNSSPISKSETSPAPVSGSQTHLATEPLLEHMQHLHHVNSSPTSKSGSLDQATEKNQDPQNDAPIRTLRIKEIKPTFVTVKQVDRRSTLAKDRVIDELQHFDVQTLHRPKKPGRVNEHSPTQELQTQLHLLQQKYTALEKAHEELQHQLESVTQLHQSQTAQSRQDMEKLQQIQIQDHKQHQELQVKYQRAKDTQTKVVAVLCEIIGTVRPDSISTLVVQL